VDDEANGQRQPELKSFYEAIAANLKGAEQVLIFGNATGASSAMDYLVDELNQNHPDIAKRIVGAIAVDEQHLTEGQLLAQAWAFYQSR
jgi:phosphoheptose isomerase